MRRLDPCTLVVVLSFTVSRAFAEDRIPVPANAMRETTIAATREAYGAELRVAKAAPDKIKLAEKLLLLAADSKDDPASQFVLFRDAADLASQAGDVVLAFKAVDQFTERFEQNSVELKLKVVQDASKAVRSRESNRFVATGGMELVQLAIAADDFDRADASAKLAIAAANRVPDAALIKEAAAVVKEIPTLRTAYRQVQPALQVLLANPADPAAAASVGKYYCFVKGDWTKGLPLLSIGNEALLKAIAEKDVGQPTGADKQIELGDAYWDLATSEQGIRKDRLQERAAEWYSKAVPGTTGITKARIEKRVAQVAKIPTARLSTVALNRPGTPQVPVVTPGARVDEVAIAKWVLELGGKVTVLEPGTGRQLTPAGPEHLRAGMVLYLVDLSGTGVRDSDLTQFAGCPALIDLRLNNTKITSVGLGALKTLSRLDHLEVAQTPLSVEGADAISRIGSLKHLDVQGTALTDQGLILLRALSLTVLLCHDNKVTDSGLEALAAMQRLTTLGLRGNAISGDGLRHLSALKKLNTLDLNKTNVNNESLQHLKSLEDLRILRIKETRITSEGASTLKTHLPYCDIQR